MANTFFQFKQFTINQDQCAMKVCTDACILGSLFASRIRNKKRVLDIGAGTGLQMLMLAQGSEAMIDGIEIDAAAHKQATENLAESKWSDRFQLFKGDVKTFEFDQQYDFIISNPPFYEQDLSSPGDQKNLAMHSGALKFDELLDAISKLLTPDGSFGILLPWKRYGYFKTLLSEKEFFVIEEITVKQSPAHQPFRIVVHVTRINTTGRIGNSELIINDTNSQYTPEFVSLLKDYYLKL